MRNIIGIRLLSRGMIKGNLLNTKIKDIPFLCGFAGLNPQHCHVMGIQWGDYNNELCIGLIHNEFSVISDVELIKTYSIIEAQKRFPFLFADTNPLLYRKF